MKNIGKIFESQLQKSVPDYALLYRLPDDAQSFSKNSSMIRFSVKKPFDFLLWDSIRHILYALEVKTVAKKSISFERSKEDNGVIHYHQIKGLNDWNAYDGITCGFIIGFREPEKTIFLDINEFNKLIGFISKKSFNLDDLESYQIKYTIIPQTKLRKNYEYDIDDFLSRNNGGKGNEKDKI